MKKRYIFIENENLYNFVMNTLYFNEARKEREIFELWRKGENNCNIAKIVGYGEATIRNRKKEISQRYNELLDNCKINFF